MKMTAKFEAEGESFNACFEQLNSAFNAEFSASGGGQDGKDGATFTPSVSEDGVISWTNDRELPNPEPVNIKGEKGINGKNGFSPIVSVEQIEGGNRVNITDKDGTQSFDVMDGVGGEGGGVTSWNDLTDKPFGAEMTGSDTLNFGRYPPLGEFKVAEEAELCFKWSNNTPSDADFAAGAELYFQSSGNSSRHSVVAMPITDWVATLPPDIAGNISVVGDISVVLDDDDGDSQLGFIVRTDGASIMGTPIEVGTYIYRNPDNFDYGYLKINGYTGFETIVTFDGDYSKYEYVGIRDTYMVRVSDKVLTVDDLVGALVGYAWGEKIGQYLIEESDVVNVEDIGIDGLYGVGAQVLFERSDGYKAWKSEAIVSIGGDLNAAQAAGLLFTKEGTYFMIDTTGDDEEGGLQYIGAVSCLTGLVEKVKPLDEKYMPTSVVLESELESKGYQTEAQVTELINNALGVIENGTY